MLGIYITQYLQLIIIFGRLDDWNFSRLNFFGHFFGLKTLHIISKGVYIVGLG